MGTGGNGVGAQEELAYTQNATGVMGVAINNNVGEDHGDATKTRALQGLLGLRSKIGEKAFQQWAFGRLIGFQKEEILQQELYEQSLQGKTEENKSELDDSALSRTEFDAENALLGLWKSAEFGYPPYRQELAQQFIGQLDLLMQKLSCQNTSRKHATVRRLLPIETERLMGFPDNWTRIPWKGKSAEECPDSPRYKACGNSMCVNVMRWIGMRIENVERKTGKSAK
jgi:DNA (cytosine-5)-methyltransferase 1